MSRDPNEAFFTVVDVDGGTLRARPQWAAVGPWSSDSLHAGPPSALLVAACRRGHDPGGRIVTRVAVEILRPLPVEEVVVRTSVRRPGRRVELLDATLSTTDGTPLMTAAVWRLAATEQPIGVGVEGDPMPGPEGARPSRGFFRPLGHRGYVDAMEVRFVEGGWEEPGVARAWMRMPFALLDDEPTAPVERVLVAADSINGVSARAAEDAPLGLDSLFVNVDLTAHLLREPEGEWIGLDAHTVLTDHSIGLAHAVLHDVRGPIGRASQSLVVAPG